MSFIATWKDFLQVVYDWYAIFILQLEVTFWIDGFLFIVWCHDAAIAK